MYKENSRVYMCGRECTIYLIQGKCTNKFFNEMLSSFSYSILHNFSIENNYTSCNQKELCNDYKVLTCRDS